MTLPLQFSANDLPFYLKKIISCFWPSFPHFHIYWTSPHSLFFLGSGLWCLKYQPHWGWLDWILFFLLWDFVSSVILFLLFIYSLSFLPQSCSKFPIFTKISLDWTTSFPWLATSQSSSFPHNHISQEFFSFLIFICLSFILILWQCSLLPY